MLSIVRVAAFGARRSFSAAASARKAAAAVPPPLSPVTALSALDGRYAGTTAPLRAHLSEYALIKQRVVVEVEWLRALAAVKPGISELPAFDAAAQAALDAIVARFDSTAAARVKAIEARTNHDVKAVEYFLKEEFAASGNTALAGAAEFLHFAATSEDVNNTAYALMVRAARDEVLLPAMRELVTRTVVMAEALADVPMLSRTHGQPATPTTMGKEWANWAHRLARQVDTIASVPTLAKFNGAVGSYNAHVVSYPGVDWPETARGLVENRLGLVLQPYSTQIEPHDWLAELFHAMERFNTVLLDLDRDVWGYISLGYFTQRRIAGEVGSSTMPHKINPIDFENSEGNCGLANALLHHLAHKLPVSRFQRDLSDSTALRSVGSAFGYTLLAIRSAHRGIGKLDVNGPAMLADLDTRWEVLAEPIQTVMRRYGAPTPYEQLKDLTRGQGAFSADAMRSFVRKLEAEKQIPKEAAEALLQLTPASYVGLAPKLARGVRLEIEQMWGSPLSE